MAVSMKDLQSSSDEDLQDGDVDAESLNSANINLDAVAELPKQQHTGGWIKGQVSESLRRISTRMTPTTSLSESSSCQDNTIDEEDTSQQKITKVPEATDIKVPADNAGDSMSKRHWIKGQINNYISKSKRLYNRNESSASNDKKSPTASSSSTNLSDDNESISSNTSKITELNTYSSNTPPNDITLPNVQQTIPPKTPPRPILPLKSKTPENCSPQNSPMSGGETTPIDVVDVENELMPSKLTFSELLNSDCSQSNVKINISNVENNESVYNESSVYNDSNSSNNDNNNNKNDNKNNNSSSSSTTTSTTTPTTTSGTTSRKCSVGSNGGGGGSSNNISTGNQGDSMSEIFSEEEELNNLTNQIIKEDLQNHLRPGEGTSITFFNIWVCTCLTCAYFLYKSPSYVQGVITGSVITYLIICIIVWFLCPSAEIYDSYQSNLKSFLKRSRKPEVVKSLPKLDSLIKPKDLRGWIFMTATFDEVFDKDAAKEVFSLLHKDCLYIFTCKAIKSSSTTQKLQKNKKILKGKNKKANQLIMEQPEPMFKFESGCLIDLSECLLNLKPDDLPIRRIWSRKYPIQLIVPQGKLKRKNIDMTLEELTLILDDTIEGRCTDNFMQRKTNLNDKEETFYMFWNTGREKEDWFYRLQLCISPLKHQVTFKDVNDNKLSKQPSNSYPHYMTELIKESEKVMQRTVNGKKMQPYLAWLNIFLGRAFWDFWHESVWAQKLHQKIQTRLSKLNTPPFITDITLTDLNCGHNIPIIHKGSMPVLDEHGIWADLQITYKGYFTLTLETQLNIDYYIGLVSSIVKQKESKDNISKIKLSGLPTQYDENVDDSLSEKDINDADASSLPDVDDFHDEIQDVYSDAFEHPDQADNAESFSSSSDANESDPFMADPRTKAFLQSRTGKKVVSLVGWLAKSKIAKRVAETDFAKKAYERAYKKFQKMPIVLKVEIQSVKGNVAVNIPPPPTNRLWYGFRGNPVIFIMASPKVGDKQVRLTYLTNWIERKLKEEFKKFLVLPNMQDLSIKLMDSHLHDISPDRPES